MEYLDVEEARAAGGLRLALTAGGPGPWSEAAKAVFAVKGVSFTPVRQDAGDANERLHAWTGHRNAPIAVYQDERPRAGWAEILLLAERLGDQPALLPADPEARALVLGLCHEICGEEGLGWSRRLLMLDSQLSQRERLGRSGGRLGFMAGLYGYAPERVPQARERVIALLEMLSARQAAQRARGSAFLVGDALSAVDVYWACFAVLFAPIPHAQCPMPAPLRAMYTVDEPDLLAALNPALLAHRDRIYARYLTLPLDF